MMRAIFGFFGVLLSCAIIADSYYVHITQYNNYNCEGWQTTTEYDRLCMTWPNFGWEISGIRIHTGSCVMLNRDEGCTGDTLMIGYPTRDICDLPDWIEDHVLSVRDCRTRTVEIHCPVGSFVREIVHGEPDEGVTVHCYKPTDTTPTYSQNTHSSAPSNPKTTGCEIGSHGITWEYDSQWEIFHTPKMVCSRTSGAPTDNKNFMENQRRLITENRIKDGGTGQNLSIQASGSKKGVGTQAICGGEGDWAFSGLIATIDEAGVIKEWNFACAHVPDPTSMCAPREMMGLVVQCDNTESGNEMSCTFERKIGVGKSSTITESEGLEMGFSFEFGYSMEAGIPGLSASMSATLGYSELVAYEWSRSDTITWSEEKTITASITVRPYTHSKLEQLVGKCSFYGTYANYFKQTDLNVTSGETKITYFSA